MKNLILITFLGSFITSSVIGLIFLLLGGDQFTSIDHQKLLVICLLVFCVSFFVFFLLFRERFFKPIELQMKKHTLERAKEMEQMKSMETYRKEYLGNVSHELKTPIFNIQGYILTLLDGGIDDPVINRDYLKRSEKSVDRMISIVEDLQAITQLETGELELEQENFDVTALVKDVIDAQELRAKEKKINIVLRDAPANPVIVNADKFRIRQVLVNLVVNSVRYGREEGETRIKISDTGSRIHVEVADNGIGISKEHLPRVFERFYRADKSRSREMGGTGLGLSIVKHIIEAHGQTINVLSTDGVGSVFVFTLNKA